MELAIGTKRLGELTAEYKELLSYGYVMGFGTRTYWTLTKKYECSPEALWMHLSLKEKLILWHVEHKFLGDEEALEYIDIVEY